MNENQEELETETASLYSSTFAQVIFANVEKVYMTDVPVKCNYTLTPRIIAHPKDWIGIFKVGWSTARDYHTFVWAPLPKEENQVERQQQVTFEAYYLPKDYNDFYQFCYVTQKGEIRGASTPFGFRPVNSNMSDHLDNDYNQEMLIITTQDKLEETEREKDALKTNNLKLVEENTVLKEKIKEFETQAEQDKEEHSKALEMMKKDRMVLEKQMLEQKVDIEVEMKAQIEKAEQLRKELAEKEAACLSVQKENQDLQAKMTSAQASVEQSKQEHDKAVDKGKQLQQETKVLKMEISTKATEITSLSETKDQIARELKAALDNLQHIQSDLNKQKEENEKLTEELKKMSETETELQNQIATVHLLQQAWSESEKLKTSHSNTERQLQEQAESLCLRLKATEEQVQKAEQRHVQTTAELRAAEADRERSDANLHDAHQEIQHWKSKFEKMDQMFSKSEGCTEGGSPTEHPLQKEIASLKAKLLTGKSCYVQKYKECQRLHKQIDKLKSLLEDKNKCHSPIKEIVEITENTETAASSGGVSVQQPGTELAEIKSKLGDRAEKAMVRFKDIEHELDTKTHIVDLRTMEVAELQEEIKRLNRKIDDLRMGSNHRSGSFQLEHPNPYSLTVPKVHSGHTGLLFGNPYSECDVNKAEGDEFLDVVQNPDGTENSQDTVEGIPAECQRCPVCEVLFPANLDDFDFEQHVQKHFVYECPVCQKHFPDNKENVCQAHVESHFIDFD
ncbi:tax1-binding protein 1 homolog B-like isoform X3 [Scyliorhinus canicula]|uniref:tax1-binding protein 1 homolog B-like isoform X3 n=1 Tax=Scyliorhinus canicula TaxID=7830 RepID=UPI0018F4B5BB|nr:tax1-binding protein 1 homolog B-like isoform X3 [Scyliorhinus canicula]